MNNSFINLINKADFDTCLKELANDSTLDNYSKGISLALVYGYKGDFQRSIEVLEDLYREKSVDDLINLQTSILLLNYYFIEIKSTSPARITDVRSYISFLLTEVEKKKLEPFWQALYEYTEAKIHENNNDLYGTIKSFELAGKLLEKQNNKYELMKAYYRIGSSYRTYGDYFSAQEQIEKCLKVIPKNDHIDSATYLNYLGEILFLRTNQTYKKSLEYLQQSSENWKFLENNSESLKTIRNLGLVQYLTNNFSECFTNLSQVFESVREELSIRDNVRNYLLLIKVLTDLQNTSEAKKYLETLESYINFDLLYEDELQLASAFVVRQSQTLSYQIIPLKVFEKLTEKNKLDYERKLKVLLNELDLTVVELKFAQVDEVLTITQGLVKQLLDHSEKSFELLVHTTKLIDCFKAIREEKNQDVPFNPVSFSFISDPLNPLIHSIAGVSILLYVLPRKGVTIDELREITELNKDKLLDYVSKLLDQKLLITNELILKGKEKITYLITEQGIREVETYAKTLTEIIQSYFVSG